MQRERERERETVRSQQVCEPLSWQHALIFVGTRFVVSCLLAINPESSILNLDCKVVVVLAGHFLQQRLWSLNMQSLLASC